LNISEVTEYVKPSNHRGWKYKVSLKERGNLIMWETTFWIDGVQAGEPLITTSLDDNTKFIEGIVWGLREVMKLEHVETRIKYKDD